MHEGSLYRTYAWPRPVFIADHASQRICVRSGADVRHVSVLLKDADCSCLETPCRRGGFVLRRCAHDICCAGSARAAPTALSPAELSSVAAFQQSCGVASTSGRTARQGQSWCPAAAAADQPLEGSDTIQADPSQSLDSDTEISLSDLDLDMGCAMHSSSIAWQVPYSYCWCTANQRHCNQATLLMNVVAPPAGACTSSM